MHMMSSISSAYQPVPVSSKTTENAKVAIKHYFPFKEFAIHSLALVVVVVVFWANFTGRSWKDFNLYDTQLRNELKGWQFASKMHELLMVASLSFVVLYYMRKLLLGRKGIPFGLVSVTYTISPSTLFSKPFWKAISAQYSFGMLIAIACLFSVVLGPSSAITMIPTLGWFKINDARLDRNSKISFLGGDNDIWPQNINVSSTGGIMVESICLGNPFTLTIGCPATGFNEIYKWFSGFSRTNARDSLEFNDVYSNAKRGVSFSTTAMWEDTRHRVQTTGVTTTLLTPLTVTTLGTFFNYATHYNLGDIHKVLYPRISIATDTPTYQPVVHANCHMDIVNKEWKELSAIFPSTKSSWSNDNPYQDDPYILGNHDDIWNELPDQVCRFKWLKDDRSIASSSLLAIAIVPTVTTNDIGEDVRASAAVTCSIDARWATSRAYFEPKNSSFVSTNVTDRFTLPLDGYHDENRIKYGLSEAPIDLGLEWARYLNLPTNFSTGGAMDYMLSAAMQRDLERGPMAYMSSNVATPDLAHKIEESIAMLLGVIVADGIAQTVSEWWLPWLLAESEDHKGNYIALFSFMAEKMESPSEDIGYQETLPSYNVSLTFERYGYGFAYRGLSSSFAVTILSTYALLLLIHMTYVTVMHLWKRCICSNGWDSVGDLLALAINSTPSTSLCGTSGGVENGATWRKIMKIRETGDHHLELRFDTDEHTDVAKLVQVGDTHD